MAISMDRAIVGRDKGEPRPKLNPGYHLVECVSMCTAETDHGSAFFCNMRVVKGPTQAGYSADIAVFPDTARGGNGMPLAQAKALEEGKIQRCVAAVAGYPKEQANKVNQEFFTYAVPERKKGPDGKPLTPPPTPLAGRRFIVLADEYIVKSGKNAGKTGIKYETFPETHPCNIQEYVPPVGASAPMSLQSPGAPAQAAPVPAAPPAAPAVPALPEGWLAHPTAPGYAYNPTVPTHLYEVATQQYRQVG